MNLWSDFKKLKTSIPGNREKFHYEESFGMPREEFEHITMPNKYNRRIISELEYAIRLSEVNGGKFDANISEALKYLLSEMKEEGSLSKTACMKAEEMIIVCKDAAKEYKLILCGHAHIDMNWLWGYQETVAITLATFRTVLNLMKQYPDFKFSQSQASCYKIVEQYDTELMEEIKERIKEGRWEVTASAWVETDKNMPNTESLLRHIKYTKNYLKETWDLDPDSLEVDFSPDTFGHSRNIPEINCYGGVKYYYHCRGNNDGNALYRWKSPSGKEVLVYKEQYWYNGGITPHISTGLFEISKKCEGFKTGLIVYGVGDHGGGPTRRDVERALEMMEWPIYPTLKFGTFNEFFREAESVRDKLPIVDRELNFIFRGCYTTQSRIKKANRKSEAVLTDAEALMAFAQAESNKTYCKKAHEKAWQNVLFNHFHDILTGSCVQDSREHAMGLFADSLAYATTQYQKAATLISEMTDTSAIEIDNDIEASQSEGAGCGFSMNENSGVPSPERGCGKIRIFNVFNPVAVKRKTLTEITVWDWVGDLRLLTVEDVNGNPLQFQLLNGELQHYWDHKFFKILVDTEIPSLGYTTVIVKEKEANGYNFYLHPQWAGSQAPKDDHVMDNGLVRAVFDRKTACLKSFIDLETGVEYINEDKQVSLLHITTEAQTCDAWNIGRYLDEQQINAPVKVNFYGGSMRKKAVAEYRIASSSKATVTATLDNNEKALRFNIAVDWCEVAAETVPLLTFNVPLSFETDKYLFDVPAGAQYRAPQNEDLPGLQYAAAIRGDGKALALVPDCKYGYRTSKDEFAVTLINTAAQSNGADKYPDRSEHSLNIALVITEDNPKLIEETATLINHAAYYVPTGSHKGTLPTEMSFMEFNSASCVVSAVLPSEKGGEMTVRFYETCGKDDNVTVKLAKTPKSAVCVDLMGKEIESDVTVNGNEITLSVKANTIGAIKIDY